MEELSEAEILKEIEENQKDPEARAEIMKAVELFENDGNREGVERSMKLLEGIG